MDLDRFLALPRTADGRTVITLMADPSMTDATGQPAGFLSLVDKGANLRRFQVVKAEDLAPGQGPTSAPGTPDQPQAWLTRFLTALGLDSLAAKLTTKGDAPEPLTFDAAVQAERLRRARWEATDALWDVIRNIMGSDLEDKVGAVRLALGQFSTMVLGLVSAQAVAKAEDVPELLAALEGDRETAAKAGKVISARNLATITSARDALVQASAALEALIASVTPSQATTKAAPDSLEDPDMDPTKIAQLATAAADQAVKAAKAAGLTDAAKLAQIGAAASTELYKAAVMGPAQPAMPTNALAVQMGQSGGMGGTAPDPLAAITEALGSVTSLATKIDQVAAKVDSMDKALNGHGEGDEREPGALELATKAAELSAATAETVRKIAGTPAAPRGGGDPPAERETTRKAAEDADTWAGSPFDFGTRPAQAEPATT